MKSFSRHAISTNMTGWAIKTITPPMAKNGTPIEELFLVADPNQASALATISDLLGAGVSVTIVAPVSAKAIAMWGLQHGKVANVTT